jgi:hypothetical protein
MDRTTDWPWSWEEEIEWKADLEERDYDFLEEQIDNAVEWSTTDTGFNIDSLSEESVDDTALQEYAVTA